MLVNVWLCIWKYSISPLSWSGVTILYFFSHLLIDSSFFLRVISLQEYLGHPVVQNTVIFKVQMHKISSQSLSSLASDGSAFSLLIMWLIIAFGWLQSLGWSDISHKASWSSFHSCMFDSWVMIVMLSWDVDTPAFPKRYHCSWDQGRAAGHPCDCHKTAVWTLSHAELQWNGPISLMSQSVSPHQRALNNNHTLARGLCESLSAQTTTPSN